MYYPYASRYECLRVQRNIKAIRRTQRQKVKRVTLAPTHKYTREREKTVRTKTVVSFMQMIFRPTNKKKHTLEWAMHWMNGMARV